MDSGTEEALGTAQQLMHKLSEGGTAIEEKELPDQKACELRLHSLWWSRRFLYLGSVPWRPAQPGVLVFQDQNHFL